MNELAISMMIGILVPSFALFLTDMAVDTIKNKDDFRSFVDETTSEKTIEQSKDTGNKEEQTQDLKKKTNKYIL